MEIRVLATKACALELESNKIVVDIEIEESTVSGAYSLYRLPGFELELVPSLRVREFELDIGWSWSAEGNSSTRSISRIEGKTYGKEG